MPFCPSCSNEVSADQRFCAGCGAPVGDHGSPVTKTSINEPTHASISHPSGTSDENRFLPGTVLADRYRIVGMLGRGGMGEVYRADDLKLGQSVALKFLPESLGHDSPRKQRLLTEVRMARQVSHPNVCRVYDIGELDGLPFISMEYVDGEDLSSLLRRIGRLPEEKGLETARQICAGLAAAHEQGILHRDLKPANVMIDGRGRVKITDFGLACLAEGVGDDEIRSGTPAYMAPEQLAGKQVSMRSDIYALGLVLYEVVTGKPAFSGKSVAEIARRQQETQPSIPSSIVSDLDDAIERVILRCLEKDPRLRPPSALAVAAALPGGDPLAAALAAGETPSPEMVAEAGDAGGLRPVWAAALFVVALVGVLSAAVRLHAIEDLVPLDLSAGDLRVQARQVLAGLGHTDLPPSRRSGFVVDTDYLNWIRDNVDTDDRWDRLADARPPGVEFYYRYGAEPLRPLNIHGQRVTDSDPPLISPGSAVLRLDTLGRLSGLAAIPANLGDDDAEAFDWSDAFALAGLSMDTFRETDPIKPPSSPTLELQAWVSTNGDDEKQTVVQMGAVGSRLTYYEVIGPWNEPGDEPDESDGSGPAGLIIGFLISAMLVAAIFLTYRNVKAGRGDLKGAFRISLFIIVTMQLAWLLFGVRLRTLEIGPLFGDLVFGRPLGHALLHATLAWVLYVALEPYVRRLWPHSLVSWTRVLRGRFRDPLVGRDILIGFAVGFGMTAIGRLGVYLIGATTRAVPATGMFTNTDLGLRTTLADFLVNLQASAYVPMGLLIVLLLLRMLLRRDWAAITAFALIFGIGLVLSNPNLTNMGTVYLIAAAVLMILFIAVLAITVVRIGLLTTITAFLFLTLSDYPLTLDLSRWYAANSLLAMTLYAAIATWAFYIALAGRPIFKDSLTDSP